MRIEIDIDRADDMSGQKERLGAYAEKMQTLLQNPDTQSPPDDAGK